MAKKAMFPVVGATWLSWGLQGDGRPVKAFDANLVELLLLAGKLRRISRSGFWSDLRHDEQSMPLWCVHIAFQRFYLFGILPMVIYAPQPVSS